MEDILTLKNAYITLRNKCMFLKTFVSHIEAISKKSSDLLFRATHIPRDSGWKDPNLIGIIEIVDKQRNLFDEMSGLLSHTLYTDLDSITSQINREIYNIEKELDVFNKDLKSKYELLEKLKQNHINAYKSNSDPWITDVRLKECIKNICQIRENINKTMASKMEDHNITYISIQQIYVQIINTFVKVQRSLYNNLVDTMNIKVIEYTEDEKYFDTNEEIVKDKIEEKIENCYEGILESINQEIGSNRIAKHIEPLKYCVCKYRKGITGDWIIALCVVTKSLFIHIIDIQPFLEITKKYSTLVEKIVQASGSKYFVSIFENSKNNLNYCDERSIGELGDEIIENIDKVCYSIIVSFDSRKKKIKMNKDRFILSIEDKIQNGLSSLFGMSIVKLKMFTMTSCYEIFFALTKQLDLGSEKNCEEVEHKNDENLDEVFGDQKDPVLAFSIEEENPWA